MDIATQEWKVSDMEIEIVTFVEGKGKCQVDLSPDR